MDEPGAYKRPTATRPVLTPGSNSNNAAGGAGAFTLAKRVKRSNDAAETEVPKIINYKAIAALIAAQKESLAAKAHALSKTPSKPPTKTLKLYVERRGEELIKETDPFKFTYLFPGTDERFYDFALNANSENLGEPVTSGGYGQIYIIDKGGILYILKRTATSAALKTQSEEAIQEIEMLSQLNGLPYAMQIDAAVVFDTDSYILSKYVPGRTLDKWLATNPSKSEKIRVYNALLDGIKAIHEKGIIHRDIKEENIWVPDDPSLPPFYIDFGISVKEGTEAPYIGTEGYMAPYPEGIWKHHPDLNYYALGVLFEKSPIEGSALGVDLKKQGVTNEEVSARFEGGRRNRRRSATRRLKRKHSTRRRRRQR